MKNKNFKIGTFSFTSCFAACALSHSSDPFLSSSVRQYDGFKLIPVLFSELFVFVPFMLLFVVVNVAVLVGVKSLLELFTVLLFVFSLFVLLFVAVSFVLDGIKMLLLLIKILLFAFALFGLLIVAVAAVALTALCVGKSLSSEGTGGRTWFLDSYASFSGASLLT